MTKGQDRVREIADQLNALGLPRMAAALEAAYSAPGFLTTDRLDLIGSIVASEYDERATIRLNGRLRRAGLAGAPEELSMCVDSQQRSYAPSGVVDMLSSFNFVRDGLNVLVLGASSSGKTYLAKALGVAACQSFSVEYLHCDALFCGLADMKRHSIPKFEKRMRRLAKLDLLILDDFLITSTADESESGIIFQILERRSEKGKSTIVCSQRNPDGWSEMLSGDEVIADAIIKRTTRHYTILVSKKYE